MKCDFQGWATKFNVRCSDGRTIRKDAFVENDGKTVPLVYQHNHDDIENVLGHALLEKCDEGMWAYCFLNDSPRAEVARSAVEHKDITSFSIYANKLKQVGGDVIHGMIREVSLVLAGANPEAKIVDYDFAHMEDGEGEAVIYHGEEGIQMNKNEETIEHDDDRTVEDVLATFNEDQKKVLAYLIGEAISGEYDDDDEVEQSDDEGEDVMKHNVFDNDETKQGEVLSHSEFMSMLEEAKNGKALLSDVFKAHETEVVSHAIDGQNDQITETYGIHNLDYLFPEARTMERYPQWIKNEDEWVAGWLSGVKKNPFSRIKMVYADITMEEARAKGYIKGTEKKEEVFKLLKRVIGPTTIYKKQKFDRDDLIDITDLDVVSWVKGEMRMMLNNEIALAELLGDGRDPESDDKINESNLIPVIKDDSFYTITKTVNASDFVDSDTGKIKATDVVDELIAYLAEMKGTGSPNMYATKETITSLMLARDMLGHRLWKTRAELAAEIGVRNIIEVEQMTGRTNAAGTADLHMIFVNPADYVTGADKGGAINMFDDFDIDFNQYKYLMETRISGGLTKPKSALVVYLTPAESDEGGGD